LYDLSVEEAEELEEIRAMIRKHRSIVPDYMGRWRTYNFRIYLDRKELEVWKDGRGILFKVELRQHREPLSI